MGKLINKLKNMPVPVKASLAYTICSILQKSIGLITMPLFTRIMSEEQFGVHTVYTNWTGMFMIILTLNLAYGSFSTAMIRFEKERDAYISSIQGISCVLVGIFLVIYTPFRTFINNHILSLGTPFVILMVAEVIGSFAIACWQGKKRFEFKYKSIVALTLCMSLISPVLAYFLVKASTPNNQGFGRIIGYALITVIVGLAIFLFNMLKGKKLFSRKYWKYALGFNIPLIPYYLSQYVFSSSDVIMITYFRGKGDAGIYSVGYKLALVLTVILNAVNDSYVPWLYGRIRAGKQEENKKVSNGIALLMAVLLLGVTIMAPEIIGILADDKFIRAMWVVPPVAMSILLLFYSQLFINIQFYYEEKMLLVYASIGAALVNVLLNWLLVPKFGFVAAAYTTLVSYGVFALCNYYAMKYSLSVHERPNNSCDLRGLTMILIGYAALAFVAVVLYPYPIVRYAIVVAALVVLYILRNRIIAFLKNLKSR